MCRMMNDIFGMNDLFLAYVITPLQGWELMGEVQTGVALTPGIAALPSTPGGAALCPVLSSCGLTDQVTGCFYAGRLSTERSA